MPRNEFSKKSPCKKKDCDKILREQVKKDLEPPISFSLPTHDNEIKINFECERRRNKDLKCILTCELDTENQSRQILEKLYQENDSTSRRKADVLDSITEMKMLLQKVEAQKSKTQSSYNQDKSDISALKKKNDDLQEEISKLQQTLHAKKEKLRLTEESQKKEMSCLCKEKEQLQAKIKNSENDLSLVKTTLKELKSRDQHLDKSLIDTQEALEEIKLTHENDITNILLLNEKIESTYQQYQIDEDEEKNLKEELEQLKSITKDQRETLDCIESESEIHNSKLKKLNAEIDLLHPKDERLKKIISKLEIEAQEKERTRMVCQQMIQALQSKLLQARKCNAEKKSTSKQLKQEINVKREAISRFRGMNN